MNPVVHVPDLYHVRSKAILPHAVLLESISGNSSLESVCGELGIVLQRHICLCVSQSWSDMSSGLHRTHR